MSWIRIPEQDWAILSAALHDYLAMLEVGLSIKYYLPKDREDLAHSLHTVLGITQPREEEPELAPVPSLEALLEAPHVTEEDDRAD